MYVCICHQVTDKDIQLAVRSGCHDFQCLQKETGLGTQCGSCCALALEMMSEATMDYTDWKNPIEDPL